MGKYYNWLEGRWVPIDHDRVLAPEQRRQIDRRKTVIEAVIGEYEAPHTDMLRRSGLERHCPA